MEKTRYMLCPPDRRYAVGLIGLEQSIGKPMDLNACTVLLCTQGTAVVSLNFKLRKVRQGDMMLLTPEMVLIPMRMSEDFSARFVSLPAEIVDEIFYKVTSSSFMGYWDMNPVLHTTSLQYELLTDWFRQMEWIIGSADEEYQAQLLQNNFYNLCMAFDSEIRRLELVVSDSLKKNRSWALFNHFSALLNRYYMKHRDVDFYAKKLCITPDYLYKLVYKTIEMSPKELIDQQVLVAVKTYLSSTDLSIKSIAAELNFDDPSYLCRFFRRMTGMSPMDFRNSNSLKP